MLFICEYTRWTSLLIKQGCAVVLIFPNVLAFTFSVNFTVFDIFHVREKS